MKFIKTLCSLTLMFTSLIINAQTGSISGVITDGRDSTNKPIFGAQVFITGTTYGAFTGMNGEYTLSNITPGKYDITVSYVLIGEQKIEGVKVEANQNTEANLGMGESVTEETGIRIVLTKNKESEASAVNEMKNSVEIKEVVSQKEISQKGQNKASDVAQSITGVSVVEGKYVYVRGLSDRYSKTLLNGAEIPGLDPDRNAVQLDIFPSAFIQNMSVVKTFSPDLPGDFTGGLVDITTRESYDSLLISANFSAGYNPQVHLRNDFLSSKGGKLDFLGFDDGSRSFSPEINEALKNDAFPSYVQASSSEAKVKELQQFTNSIGNDMEPVRKNSPIDQRIRLTIGNSKRITRKGDSIPSTSRKVGYFAGVNYSRDYSFYENGTSARYQLENTISLDTALFQSRKLTTTSGTDNVLVGGLASVFFRFNERHKLSLNFIHNHNGTSTASYSTGEHSDLRGSEYRLRTIGYQERQVNTLQLKGEHLYDTLFFKTPTKIEWISSYSRSSQNEPDLRFFADDKTVTQNESFYQIRPSAYLPPTRFERGMTQNTIDNKIHLTKTIRSGDKEYMIKSGLSSLIKTRDFFENRMIYQNIAATYNGNPTDFLSEENFGVVKEDQGRYIPGVILSNNTSPKNSYSATQSVSAVYLMGKIPVGKKVEIITGARGELVNMEVISKDVNIPAGQLNNFTLLPSANLTYHFLKGKVIEDTVKGSIKKQDLKLQLIYNRTLARPSFREIAPFFVNDFLRNINITGNPELNTTTIDNLDLRLEFYPNSGQLFAVSTFAKKFTDPIEFAVNPKSLEQELVWKNVPSALVYGIEFEIKRDLSFLSESLKNLKTGINASLIHSEVDIQEEELTNIRNGDPYRGSKRPFFGQSPYLVNVFLQYANESTGITTNLTYNQFGSRLAIVSVGGTPNIYEQGRGELNFNITKDLTKNSKLTLRIRNILNPDYKLFYKFEEDLPVYEKFTAEQPVFSNYKKGRSISLSYTMNF